MLVFLMILLKRYDRRMAGETPPVLREQKITGLNQVAAPAQPALPPGWFES